MTAEEVLDLLEKRGVEWEGKPYNGRYKLRAKSSGLCPICEACRLVHNVIHENYNYRSAMDKLGMLYDDGLDLADAADDILDTLEGKKVARILGLRSRLEERAVK